MTLTHQQRRERRAAIAHYCRTHEVGEAANKFGMSVSSVTKAKREYGVRSGPRGGWFSHWDILAKILTTHWSYTQIADQYGVSCQYVKKIAAKAAKAGIPFPPRPRNPKAG